MENKIVSVCMITYNHESFIREAIEGVLMQKTDFSFELVIGEDCSTDSTRKICESYQIRYPAIIKLLPSDSNLGVMPNFIRTLQACTGKYIALCEGDDYWTDPLKLQKQVEFLEGNEEYVICYHDAKVIDTVGNLLQESQIPEYHKKDYSSDELILGYTWIKTLTICFRNVITNYPEESKYVKNGDNFLTSLLGNYGKGKWLGNEIKPGVYRKHNTSIWSSLTENEKIASKINTLYWIYRYYERQNNLIYTENYYNKLLAIVLRISKNDSRDINQLIKSRSELLQIKKSYSYRLSRLIMFPLRLMIKLFSSSK